MAFTHPLGKALLWFGAVIGVLLLLGGCSAQYISAEYKKAKQSLHFADVHNVQRESQWRLAPDTSIFLAKPWYPYTAVSGASDFARARFALLHALETAFLHSFPATQVSMQNLSLSESLIAAQLYGSRLLVYPQLLSYNDYTESAGLSLVGKMQTDSTLIQIMLVDVSSGHILDTGVIASKSKFHDAESDAASQLFASAASEYVQQLAGSY